MPRPRAAAALLAGLVVAAGCTGRPPEPVTVRGKILDARQKPLAGVIVRFWPADLQGGSAGDRLTGADGTFEVSCPPGKYHVTLMAVPAAHGADPASGKAPQPAKSPATPATIPPSYQDAQKTPWRDIHVGPGGRAGLVLAIAE
jgi:hypothetical protein